jgi:integrase
MSDFTNKFSNREVFLSIIQDTRRPKQCGTRKSNKPDSGQPKQPGIFPVKYRITYQRKSVYYPSGFDMTEKEWEALPGTRKEELKELRKHILDGFELIKDHVNKLIEEDTFTLEALNTRMKKGTKTSLIAAFDSRIEELKSKGQIGTATYYQCARNCIEKFMQADLKKTDIKFSEVTSDWLKRFEKHMLKDEKSYTTVSMYMRALRAIVNEAKKRGIITPSQYPFIDYTIPTAKGRKMALTVSQIKQILDHPLTLDIDQQYRDLWFFSYLCNGINMNDLLRLKYTDIQNGEIHYHRLKTIRTSSDKTKIVAAMLPDMERIIKRWGSKGEYIFEGIENAGTPAEERRLIQNITRAINERMGKIGNTLGFGPISTYTARHSFATVLKRSGASIAFISESLGHSDLNTTQNYLDSFEKEERAKNAANLVNFQEP